MLNLAASLLLLMGIAHSYLGERYILIRLFKRDNLPKVLGSTQFTVGTLRFVWHLLTVIWLGVVVLLLRVSEQPFDPREMLRVFSIVAFVSALFPLFFTRGRHLSWVIFLAVALLLWFYE